MGVWTTTGAAVAAARGHLFAFVPVFLGIGTGCYFLLPTEPGPVVWGGAAAGAVLALAIAYRSQAETAPFFWAIALGLCGFMLGGMRSHMVSGPVLEGRYWGPIQGRVVGVDRSASDAVRLMLDRVVLERLGPDRTPVRVLVSIQSDQPVPIPGTTVILTGTLMPPGGPVEPGGFDFRRHAWFLRLGGLGYTRTPVLVFSPPDMADATVARLRQSLAARIRARIPGDAGALAAAVLSGDRSGLDRRTLDNLRHSNLSHLLAISGLHLGLLAGFVFAAVRLGLVLVPRVGLRAPVKRIAAVAALFAAGAYLMLSGGNVATERAFVMVAVALGAVLADRQALTLRGLAIAAVVVLVLWPEALTGPGFQMSFAASAALIVAFSLVWERLSAVRPRWVQMPLTLLVSSSVAGAATAPIAAAHFNIYAAYGLIANLAAVPLMGTVVIPCGAVAVALMPLGLDAVPLWIMGQGTAAILWIAAAVAGLDGAVWRVPAPSGAVLPVFALGALWLMLWPGRARLVGVAPVCAAAALWLGADRPAVLIAETGGLVGVLSEEGRTLSRARGQGFVASVWLENDGSRREQAAAAAGWQNGVALPDGSRLWHVTGKRGVAEFEGCAPGDLVISDRPMPASVPCRVLGPEALSRTGSLAYYTGKGWVSASEKAGDRLWSPAIHRPPDRLALFGQ